MWVLRQRSLTQGQLNRCDSQRPDVSMRIMTLLLHHLRSHPAGRPTDCGLFDSFLHLGRDAKVCEEYLASQVHENIARFYVSVNFVIRVQVTQSVHSLA